MGRICLLTQGEREEKETGKGLPPASQGVRRGKGRRESKPPAPRGCRGRGRDCLPRPLAPGEEGRGKGSSSNILHRRSTLGRLLETKVFP